MHTIDLNADLGEGFGPYRLGADAALMPLLTSANVACGFHAGDPMTMRETVAAAESHGVAIGAHPGYPDLMGFGRRDLSATPGEITAYVIYQIGALNAVCRAGGARLRYVKAHGALYNRAATDRVVAECDRGCDPARRSIAGDAGAIRQRTDRGRRSGGAPDRLGGICGSRVRERRDTRAAIRGGRGGARHRRRRRAGAADGDDGLGHSDRRHGRRRPGGLPVRARRHAGRARAGAGVARAPRSSRSARRVVRAVSDPGPAAPTFTPLADSALTITLGDRADAATSARVRVVAAGIRVAALPPVRDIAPGYAAVTVWYDALHTSYETMVGVLEPIVTRAAGAAPGTDTVAGREHEIPVRYDGPDLDDVARRTGLSVADVVARHTGRVYTVYFLGFVPGWAYLGDLDPSLVVPRRTEPRSRVRRDRWRSRGRRRASTRTRSRAAGISSGGPLSNCSTQCGILRRSLRLGIVFASSRSRSEWRDRSRSLRACARPHLTIQDQGRPGHRAEGVPGGRAMDAWGHAVANVVVGNPANAAALEWGLSGGGIRWQQGGVFALAGAGVEATVDGEPVAMHRSERAEAGSELVITRFLGGRFVYIAFSGGIDVPLVLGSRSTYLAARFGGWRGRWCGRATGWRWVVRASLRWRGSADPGRTHAAVRQCEGRRRGGAAGGVVQRGDLACADGHGVRDDAAGVPMGTG